MPGTLDERLTAAVRLVPDYPQPGVLFRDFNPVLADGQLFGDVVDDLAARYRGRVDVVSGVEARGFVLGAALAIGLGTGFVPVRKAGKLPGRLLTASYDLEYGSASIEVQDDLFTSGQRVVLVDDVLATGGTAAAACGLIEDAGAEVVEVAVLLELADLQGRARLGGRVVHSLLSV